MWRRRRKSENTNVTTKIHKFKQNHVGYGAFFFTLVIIIAVSHTLVANFQRYKQTLHWNNIVRQRSTSVCLSVDESAIFSYSFLHPSVVIYRSQKALCLPFVIWVYSIASAFRKGALKIIAHDTHAHTHTPGWNIQIHIEMSGETIRKLDKCEIFGLKILYTGKPTQCCSVQ